jgi:hypothetical protein
MNWHPDADDLNRFTEGDLPADFRVKVARHLDGCTECRTTVLAYRSIGDQVRALPAEPLPDALKARVMASIESGAKVVLPLPSAGNAPHRRRRRGWVAAAAVILAIGITLTVGAPELRSGDSDLVFSPAEPVANGEVSVEYGSGGRFSGLDTLVLRAIFRRGGESRLGMTLPAEFEVVTYLEPGRDGRFRGSFRFPADRVYGVFAVEGQAGENIDTNHGVLWELLQHEEGVPSVDALREQVSDVIRRDPGRARAVARRSTELYPQRAEPWALLMAVELRLWGGDRPDSIRRRHQIRYNQLDSALTTVEELLPSDLWAMYAYALAGIGDVAEAAGWKDRILSDAPGSPEAISLLIENIASRHAAEFPGAALAELEQLWRETPQHRSGIIPTAEDYAELSGDPEVILRWAERRTLYQPAEWPDLVTRLIAIPTTAEIGIDRARAYLAADPATGDRYRALQERRTEHARRIAITHAAVNATIGRALIARGSVEEGRAALERAGEVSWDSDVFVDLADARISMGDTTGFTEMMARIAVDPAAPQVQRDSATQRGLLYDANAEWNRLVQSARTAMWDEVMADSKPGTTVPESAIWTDSSGATHTIRDVLGGQVTLVTYWHPAFMPDPAHQQAKEMITVLGGKIVAVTLDPPSPTVRRASGGSFDGIPMYHDLSGVSGRGFEILGFPSYIVVDHAGRIRFSSVGNLMRNLVRQVAVLIEIQRRDVIAE